MNKPIEKIDLMNYENYPYREPWGITDDGYRLLPDEIPETARVMLTMLENKINELVGAVNKLNEN